MTDKKTEVVQSLRDLQASAEQELASLKEFAEAELSIDSRDLDIEATRTPKLHTRWLDLLSSASVQYKKIDSLYKRLYLERWKYYTGTATDKYYVEYGQFNVKVQKSDIDLYLNADDIIVAAKDLLEMHSQKVSFCERSLKEISSRTFHIRAAIDWIKFSSGG